MNFYLYLKKSLQDIIENYDKLLIRTFGITLLLTIFSFIIIALLLKYSSFVQSSPKQISLLSYIFHRYSAGDVYSLVDLSKSVLLFFISIFSIGLYRLNIDETDKKEVDIITFLKSIKLEDLLILSLILFLCLILDFGLFYLDSFRAKQMLNTDLTRPLNASIYLLRIYLPIFLFSLSACKLLNNKTIKLNFKKILFVFISFWMFNELAYEFSVLIRSNVFDFIVGAFPFESQFFVESILGIPLIAFFFVGYHSVMTNSVILIDN
jgi:hypothetical protein